MNDSQSADFSSSYFDGLSARKQRVKVSVFTTKLLLTFSDGRAIDWPYVELRSALGPADAEGTLRLERVKEGRPAPETLIIDEPRLFRQIEQAAPAELTRPFHGSKSFKKITILAGLLLLPITLYLLWTQFIPAASERFASSVPVEWETRLGEAALNSFSVSERVMNAPQTQGALEAVAVRLTASVPDYPYPMRIYILDDPQVNAFALPGGHIVFYRGLLQSAASADEIAGVMAHEIQHVLQRHATRGIIRSLTSFLTFYFLIGDVNGAMQTALDIAQNLERLSFSREMEDEADRLGMAMILRAGVPPQGMVRMYKKLGEHALGEAPVSDDDATSSGVFDYFSTHPQTGARVETLQKLAEEHANPPYSPILPGVDWNKMVERELRDDKDILNEGGIAT
ncbi:MAG: M48 family metallopeptidase [Candidatus Nitrohelix vancouverensis]|uniref:M48 family metallopeptidase n=1 Tax=Candidatus Nitrohelix vancouverensis TaxID=2705534 RepID=A0A7T0BZV2_9BACT|nr:MAG: M48 family metallopeptidase [Candidatus Nitrohelix vancouverensis]